MLRSSQFKSNPPIVGQLLVSELAAAVGMHASFPATPLYLQSHGKPYTHAELGPTL